MIWTYFFPNGPARSIAAILLIGLGSRVDASISLRTVAGNSYVRGLSADGSTAVGWTDTSSGPRSFIWTTSAFGPLSPLPGDVDSRAYAVSGDGMTVVGDSGPDAVRRGIRWSNGTGAELQPLSTHVKSTAYAISSDGSTATGDSDLTAARWEMGPSALDLGIGGGIGLASSADGSVLAGGSANGAFRWSESTGVEILNGMPGASNTQARGLSADGSIVAGFSQSGSTFNRYHAVRWTSAGLQDLGLFPGGIETLGLAINARGDAVVGYGSRSSGGNRAVLWTDSLGMVDLNTFLPTQGVSLSGMILDYAFAISADGTAIGGIGHLQTGGANFGWVVSGLNPVPEPATACLLLAALGFTRRTRRHLCRQERLART